MDFNSFSKNKSITSREGIIQLYLNDIKKCIPDANKEKEQLDIYYSDKSTEDAKLDARNKIVSMNEKLIFSIAKSFAKNDDDLLKDLNSVGNLGMIEAFDHYDKSTGNRFCTFAKYYIIRAITNYLNDENLLIRPTNNLSVVPKTKKIIENFEKTEFRTPTMDEVAEILEDEYGIKLSKNAEIVPVTYTRIDSGPDDREEDDDRYLSKNMEFDNLTSIKNGYENTANIDSMKYLVSQGMSVLSEREKRVISLAFGMADDYYQACNNYEIGQIMGLTPERIRQIKNGALKKIKKAILAIKKVEV